MIFDHRVAGFVAAVNEEATVHGQELDQDVADGEDPDDSAED